MHLHHQRARTPFAGHYPAGESLTDWHLEPKWLRGNIHMDEMCARHGGAPDWVKNEVRRHSGGDTREAQWMINENGRHSNDKAILASCTL